MTITITDPVLLEAIRNFQDVLDLRDPQGELLGRVTKTASGLTVDRMLPANGSNIERPPPGLGRGKITFVSDEDVPGFEDYRQ